MSDLKNFENKNQKRQFFKILKNFGRDFLFIGIVVLGCLWMMGVTGHTQTHLICNAEDVKQKNKENYFYQNGSYFKSGQAQSTDFVFEGKYSLKLDSETPFGFGYDFEYLAGNEEVTSYVWRYATGDWKNEGKIVASIDGKLWKATENILETNEAGWEKIQFTFQVPQNTKNETLHLYCWNTGKNPIYFDDFHIIINQKEEL